METMIYIIIGMLFVVAFVVCAALMAILEMIEKEVD